MQREVDHPACRIDAPVHGHDARRHTGQDRAHLAESCWHEGDVVAEVEVGALDGSEEPGAPLHLRMGQHVVEPEEEIAPEH